MKKHHIIISIPIKRDIEIGDLVRNVLGKYSIATEKVNEFIFKPYQLVVLSEDNIKTDDYQFHLPTNTISISQYDRKQGYTSKIIAAYPKLNGLPEIGKNFVEEWCKIPISKIEVEYSKHRDNNTVPHMIITPDDEIICRMPKTINSGEPGLNYNIPSECGCMEITCDVCESKIDQKILEKAQESIAAMQSVEAAALYS